MLTLGVVSSAMSLSESLYLNLKVLQYFLVAVSDLRTILSRFLFRKGDTDFILLRECYENGNSAEINLQIQLNPHQNPNVIFLRTGKVILKLTWKQNRPQTVLNRKGDAGFIISVTQSQSVTTVTKPTCYWLKKRIFRPTNRTEDPEINSHLTLDKGVKSMHLG